MRIAICDDNKRDTAFLRDIIMQKNESVVIDCYESGADFLAAQQELSHDLVFMDIYLNGENGIDVIRKMREIPSQTEVVFTTVSDEHAVDAFSVRALHYLVKPFGEEDVAECMHRMKNASSSIHEESKQRAEAIARNESIHSCYAQGEMVGIPEIVPGRYLQIKNLDDMADKKYCYHVDYKKQWARNYRQRETLLQRT